MIRRFNRFLWVLLIVAAAFGLYMVKYRVQAIQAEIAAQEKQLEDERESLHVAAAEWSYLNQPERLQQLAAKYLKLKPMDVRQIAEVDAVPHNDQMLASMPGGVVPGGVVPGGVVHVALDPGEAE